MIRRNTKQQHKFRIDRRVRKALEGGEQQGFEESVRWKTHHDAINLRRRASGGYQKENQFDFFSQEKRESQGGRGEERERSVGCLRRKVTEPRDLTGRFCGCKRKKVVKC